MGSVLASTICHYCGPDGAKATTQDHVVPRAALPPMITLPYWYRQHLVVPSCSPCNNAKGKWRSDCVCDLCAWLWDVALKLYLPADYQMKVVRVAARSRAKRLLTAV